MVESKQDFTQLAWFILVVIILIILGKLFGWW